MVGSWAELIAIALLLLLVPVCVFGAFRQDARLKTQEATFWQELAKNRNDFIAVLFTEHFASSGTGAALHSTKIIMKSGSSQPDRVIYENSVVQDLMHREEDAAAFGRWIDTAVSQNLPAVYQLYSGHIRSFDLASGWWGWRLLKAIWIWPSFTRPLRILSFDQIDLIRADPVDYVSQFFRHVRTGTPLPDRLSQCAGD